MDEREATDRPDTGSSWDPIDERELYRRFDKVVPGAIGPKAGSETLDAEIYFERLSMSGLEEMHRYSSDPRLYEFFEFGLFESIEETRAYIEKLQQRMAGDPLSRTAMYWFIRRRSDDYLVGSAGLVDLHYGRRSVAWGYAVDPELWGSGYILQIQEALKHYVFEILQLNRLNGITMIENQRTISSLLAAGMKHEGTLRQFYCKNGEFHDGWQYGMVRQDYFESSNARQAVGSEFTIEDVVRIISEVITDEEITAESTMTNVSSWDSLTHMMILIAITEETGISLSPADSTRATSVRAIASLLAKKN